MKYTVDNPKIINYIFVCFRGKATKFTGVAKDRDGTIGHYADGYLHREDGPAYISLDGECGYYQYGRAHREDGPALIFPNGGNSYYFRGKYVAVSSDEEFERYVKLRMFE